MLTIWLARHGEAVDPDEANTDFDRALTDRGRRRMSEATTWLIARERSPELILHSPLLRAKQTADAIADAIAGFVSTAKIPVRTENNLAPGVNIDALMKAASDTAMERIACVGHQPDMSHCLAEMIGGGHIDFSPGTIACVTFHGVILRSAGRLRWVVEPRWFS